MSSENSKKADKLCMNFFQPPIQVWIPKGFICPGYFLSFFLKPVHPTMAVEKFQIYDINITGRYICESKS